MNMSYRPDTVVCPAYYSAEHIPCSKRQPEHIGDMRPPFLLFLHDYY